MFVEILLAILAAAGIAIFVSGNYNLLDDLAKQFGGYSDDDNDDDNDDEDKEKQKDKDKLD
jgi:hypothetical protein